jgi:tetratricopeptide (TPR) repeat protein
MASKSPIVRQVAWLSLLPQFALIVCIIVFARFIGFRNYVLAGAIIYLTISFLLRFGIPFHHRKGIALFKKGSFVEAIPFFEKSYTFFKRNVWIDKYRNITLLSSSRASYTEMALLNIAFCYGQSGDGKRSKEYYEKTLSEFPNSEIAKASLRMFESAKDFVVPVNSVDPKGRAVD